MAKNLTNMFDTFDLTGMKRKQKLKGEAQAASEAAKQQEQQPDGQQAGPQGAGPEVPPNGGEAEDQGAGEEKVVDSEDYKVK